MKKFLLLLPLSALVVGCGWGTYDRNEKYLEARSIKRVDVPPALDKPDFEDALVIPQASDVRDIAGQRLNVGLPDSIATDLGVDQIVIKKLGDTRWVFVDTSPATVWPKVRQFWQDNNIPLAVADPSRGIMESDWIVGGNGSADQVFAAMRGDKSAVTLPASARYKFRVRIEPGIRSGSTEIYLEEHSLPLGDLVSTGVDWTGTSDNTELEGVALNSIAYYLGDEINRTPSFSMLATNIGGQRAELIPDRLKPVLKYKLPFDRAWATVGDALEQAKINVEDLDRSSAIYYVYYDAEHAGEPGFFSRLFQGDEAKAERNDKNRYIVRLDAREKTDEVDVTVMKDAKTLANADVAEQLLKIIKEYST